MRWLLVLPRCHGEPDSLDGLRRSWWIGKPQRPPTEGHVAGPVFLDRGPREAHLCTSTGEDVPLVSAVQRRNQPYPYREPGGPLGMLGVAFFASLVMSKMSNPVRNMAILVKNGWLMIDISL